MVDAILRRRLSGAVLAIVVLLIAGLVPIAGAARTGTSLVPIGGGYSEEALQGFAQVAVERASPRIDTVVDLLVAPSTYGTSLEDREENIELAGQRTQQVEDACMVVLSLTETDFTGCEAELLMLFDRDQAEDPVNSEPLTDRGLDGIFMLGGDQTIAMEVLADTVAEERLAEAYQRGIVFGGSSAGAAVQSQTMIAGYVDTGWPYNALERDQIIIWWADNPGFERGLSFGSDDIVTGQHFYQRGRITRLLNTVAQSDEHFNGDSLLGLGVDYATGAEVTTDNVISGVFGASSVLVIDGETGRPNYEWLGENQTLSAERILTSVLAPGTAAYDIQTRTPSLDGSPVEIDLRRHPIAGPLQIPYEGTLILGGDLSVDWSGQVLDQFYRRASAESSGRIAIVVAGYENNGQAQTAGNEYADILKDLGWQGQGKTIDVIAFDEGTTVDEVIGAVGLRTNVAGVIFVGGDQSLVAEDLSAGLGDVISGVMETVDLTMTDRAMTAVVGDWFVANPDPIYGDNHQDESIASFRSDYANVQAGLGIIPGAAFEPVLTYEQRWGRLYGIGEQHPETFVYGISENTALILEGGTAQVIGERSVVGLDASLATYATGENGAFTALNVLLHLYAPDELVPSRPASPIID